MTRRVTALIMSLAMLVATLAGCTQSPVEELDIPDPADVAPLAPAEDVIDISLEMVPLTETPAMFAILMPAASGTNVKKNEKALIDISNAKDGYFMAKYLQKTTKALRVMVKGPSGASYTYTLKSNGDYEVYPFSDGNGSYSIGVYEQVDGTKYATANTAAVDVKLTDEFAPFLRPNQYVNYNENSKVVKKAAEVVSGAKNLTEKITSVYKYVISNITYDKQLASTVKSGYLPNLDDVLDKGKGICFDYAALMTAMLRCQEVPAKLVVGYTGEMYHAWITVYSKDSGWIDSAIYFDGKTWKLMDPTFASTGGQSSEVMKYIGDGKNYTAKYLY